MKFTINKHFLYLAQSVTRWNRVKSQRTLSPADQLDFRAQSGYRVERAEHVMYIEFK